MEEDVRYCDYCGGILDEGEGTWVGDEVLCQDCVDEQCVICDHCGEAIWHNDAVEDENTTLCQECFGDHYYRCECCQTIVHNSNVNWRMDLPYCEPCFDDFDDEIEQYSYKPEPIFYGDGNLFMGVELEVDEGGKDDDNAGTLKSIANSSDEHIYIKADGSLDDGFEIVSHPMTLYYHMHEMDWESVLKEAVNMGYRSHQTSTCGLHVHVNRDAFGSNQAEQEEVIAKILFFIEKHWAEMFKFSRRSQYNIDRWAARYGYEKTGKEILAGAKDVRVIFDSVISHALVGRGDVVWIWDLTKDRGKIAGGRAADRLEADRLIKRSGKIDEERAELQRKLDELNKEYKEVNSRIDELQSSN